jgi:hypothetical protein
MSNKKKKKKSGAPHLSQKALIQRFEKERRAIFKRKLVEVMCAINAQDILLDLPREEFDLLYLIRIHPHKVISEEGFIFPANFTKLIQSTINDYLKNQFFSFNDCEHQFSHEDYFGIVLTLKYWVRTLDKDKYPKKEQYIKAMKPMLDYCVSDQNPELQFILFLRVLSENLTFEPLKMVFYLTSELQTCHSPRLYHGFNVTLCAMKPDIKTVKFDGHNRSIFSYISFAKTANIPTLKAGDITPKCLITQMELPVYYQKHVMQRLTERLDCLTKDHLKLQMDESLAHPQLTPLKDNRALLAFTFLGYKLGYFVVEVADGMAVLRTFLFLTNEGTPEGNRLKNKLGLNKLDNSYVHLDRLSTFLHSNIKDDEQLPQILKDCGCEDLLKIDPNLVNSTKKETFIDASFIKKYLSVEVAEISNEDQLI